MGALRLVGLFAVIPTTLLLTVSFFVLFAIRKTQTQGLKVFGYVVAVLLWVAALLVFSVGVYTLSTGRHPMIGMMQEMMGGKTPAMMRGQKHMMMKDKIPAMLPGQKDETTMKH